MPQKGIINFIHWNKNHNRFFFYHFLYINRTSAVKLVILNLTTEKISSSMRKKSSYKIYFVTGTLRKFYKPNLCYDSSLTLGSDLITASQAGLMKDHGQQARASEILLGL